MFLKKKFRLTWKDINFLLTKRNNKHSRFFSCLWFLQYPNNSYHQYSVNISLKYSKSAVKRRKLKKVIIAILSTIFPLDQSVGWKYYKVFFFLNKNSIETLIKGFLTHTDNFEESSIANKKIKEVLTSDLKSLIKSF